MAKGLRRKKEKGGLSKRHAREQLGTEVIGAKGYRLQAIEKA